jgi:hypothetical protein
MRTPVPIRTALRRKLLLTYIALAIAAVCVFAFRELIDQQMESLAIGFGALVAVAALLFVNLGLRCPRCNGNLAMTAQGAAFSLRKKHRVSFCQYCGVSLDESA